MIKKPGKTTQDRNGSTNAEDSSKKGLTRRNMLGTLGAGAVGVGFAGGSHETAHAQTAQTSLSWAETGPQPYADVRVIELSETLAGRLAGLMLADQGAEVFIAREADRAPSPDLDDTYFDRGKTIVPAGDLSDVSSADVIIVDGTGEVDRAAHQIVLRVVAALPGDEAYGDLPADCDEGLVNALVGFFTDMSVTGPMLGRPVIFTPLPLCSVYAGVNGAVGVGAALVDRLRTGLGRDVTASRIAGGLSAIGALNLTVEGLPEHLMPIQIGGLPPEDFRAIVARAAADPREQNWLEQRFAPLAGPFRCADGNFILPLTGANRRLTRWCLQVMGLYDEALELGMVDLNAFDADNFEFARNNLADSLALRFDLTSALADGIAPIFASRTAEEWQKYFAAHGLPATMVKSFDDWQQDEHARRSGLISAVRGTDDFQIGRMAWVKSAAPYPDQHVAESAEGVPSRTAQAPSASADAPSRRPLAGYKVLDLGNVVAAPSCGRMLTELGADVTLVVPKTPFHSPTIVAAWSAEYASGKKSIIVDANTDEGIDIIRRLAAEADIVSGNFLDDQLARLRLDPVSLRRLNPNVIGLQITALRGERGGPRFNDKGYDPSVQGTTGIALRFGGPDSPTYHGIASAVDYLCGYLGVWGGVSGLYAREKRGDGRGDWTETSLAAAATLTQLTLQHGELPESAIGQAATGMTEGERVYQLSDGWIFAMAPSDLSAELSEMTVADALADLKARGIAAVPVQTCRGIADRHRENPTRTAVFERTEKDGWASEMFAPSWIVFDDEPYPRSAPASRIGADGPEILQRLGLSQADVDALVAAGVVGRTEWRDS